MSSDIEFENHLIEVHGNLINFPWQCVLCDGYASDPAQFMKLTPFLQNYSQPGNAKKLSADYNHA